MGKKSFVFYDNWALLISSLSDIDAGALIKSVCNHRMEGGELRLDGTLGAIEQMIITTMDEDALKYDETCEKRRASASLGGKQKVANASKCKQMVANDSNSYQKLADKEKDKEKDKDKETDIDNNKYDVLRSFYNSLSNLPECRALTKTRVDKIKELLDAFTLDEVKEVFIKANGNSWLCGGNEKKWKADFDWLIDIDNFVKVQDGRYDGLKTEKKSNYDFEALERETRGIK